MMVSVGQVVTAGSSGNMLPAAEILFYILLSVPKTTYLFVRRN